MRRTSIRVLVLTAVAVALVALLVLRWLDARGSHGMPVAWIEDIAILLLGLLVFRLGWTVRAYQKGKKPNLDPIRAARTYVLAKAGAITGAILTGRYLASVLDAVGDLGISAQRERALAAGIAVLCSVALTALSLIAERFCQLPPPEDDAPGEDGRGPEALAG